MKTYSWATVPVVFLLAIATPGSSRNVFSNKKSKRKKSKFPPRQEGRGRCDKDTSILDLVVCASGGLGEYDRNRKNFDILREAVNFAGLLDSIGDPGDNTDAISGVTVFMPDDRAFYKTAKELGYKGGYNEEQIVDFLADELGEEGIAVILLYHVVPDELTFDDLWDKDGEQIDTALSEIEAGQTIEPDEARKVRGIKRIRIKDGQNSVPEPKIHNMFNDLETLNGICHVIKGVLLPRT